MGNILGPIGQLLSPIGTLFHYVFYEPVYNLLMFIYYVLHLVTPSLAYGLAIIALTLIVRSALIPLTVRQLRSSREMQVLQPKLKQLQAQYKNDPQGLMAAQRALYKEHGVSPASGCLPLVIQLPILYSLFFAFNTTLRTAPHESASAHLAQINADIYPFLPHLTSLPNTHFLWLNLAAPDPTHILPIVAGVLTFIQLKMAMPVRKPQAPGTNPDPTSQATQTTQYLMPLITVFFAWQYAAGLALYWTVGTLYSAVQQYFLTGWGSLATVPGFNRILPPPQEVTTSSTPAIARPVADSPEPVLAAEVIEEGEAGIAGFFSRLRRRLQPPTPAPAGANGLVASSGTQQKPASRSNDSGAQAYRPRDRKPRPTREAPMLVKRPVSNGETPEARATEPARETNKLPEDAIARDASGTEGVSNAELPEKAIRRDASGDGVARGGTSSNSSSGNGATATKARPATSNGAPRSGSSSSARKSGGKSQNSNRSRNGRAKGGR